jgi:CO/xanthine dehydrogenase Mo-binding subunit
MDIGRTLNPALARGVVNGGVAMGLSLASREIFEFTERGAILDPNFRTYGMLRFGEQPEYQVEFLETPERDSPYGARGLGEDGIIGIPAALANSLSAAAGVDFDALPLTPERLWRTQMRAGTGP